MPYREQSIEVDGFVVYLYRSRIDGRMVIDIDSGESQTRDNDEDNCPVFRLFVNEACVESEEISFPSETR